jgi:DNA polymerase-3 subunit delta
VIFFLYGQDTFRSRQKLKEIKEKFRREIDPSGLNQQTLDGSKLEAADFEQATMTQPFLAKKRLIIVEDLISKNRGQKNQKEILEFLEKNDLKDVILIFWESAIDPAKIKKADKSKIKPGSRRSNLLLARLKQEKYAQAFDLMDMAALYPWTQAEIKKRGGQIQPAALKILVDLVGNDLWQLNSEIEKLLALAKNQPITAAQVMGLVQTKLDDNIFKLTDALGAKNKKMALKLISDQLKSGTSPTELLGKIVWQFKNLLLIKEFMEKNGNGYQANRLTYEFGLHPFVIKKTMAQVGNYQLNTLKKIYRQLLQIDYQFKTSAPNAEALLDLLVIQS